VGHIFLVAGIVTLEDVAVFFGFPPALAVMLFPNLVLVALMLIFGGLHPAQLADIPETSGREIVERGLGPETQMNGTDE